MPEMDPADRALIQSYIEKYVNTGVQPSDKDKLKMLELTKKYQIKINNNPRQIMSRFVRVRRNTAQNDGTPIPYVRLTPKKPSKGARKKIAARERKEANREQHS